MFVRIRQRAGEGIGRLFLTADYADGADKGIFATLRITNRFADTAIATHGVFVAAVCDRGLRSEALSRSSAVIATVSLSRQKRSWLEERVEEDEEFASDGDEGDFGGFTSEAETLIEGFEVVVVAGGDESSLVEEAAGGSAAAGDVFVARASAAVVDDGGDAGELGNGAWGEAAELGQVGEQAGGDAQADAGDQAEGLDLVVEQRRFGLQELGDARIEFQQALLQPAALGVQLLAYLGIPQRGGEELGVEQALDVVFAQLDPVAQPGMRRVNFRRGLELRFEGIAAQQLGVDRIGLLQPAQAQGKVPDPPRIEQADGDAQGMGGGEEEPFVAAARFTDQIEAGMERAQALELACNNGGLVGDLASGLPAGTGELQGRFADIAGDIGGGGHTQSWFNELPAGSLRPWLRQLFE